MSGCGTPPLLTIVSMRPGGAAAEERFELALAAVDDVERVDARHADRAGGQPDNDCRIAHFGDALGEGGDGQEGIDAQCGGDHRAVGDEQAVMDAAVAREHAAELVNRAVQVVLAHRASAQRVGGDQVASVEDAPGGVGDEVGAERACVAADLLVHAGEDLLARLVPLDGHAAVGLVPGRVEVRCRGRRRVPSPGRAWCG